MTDLDDELKRRYRELATEEPSAVIDAAILARARRRRPWTARWAGPVSIAAVLVLGIGVSLRMQLEQPGIETSAPETRSMESSSGFGLPRTPPPPVPATKDEARVDAFTASPPAANAPETMLAQKRVAPAPVAKPKAAPQELKERVAASPALEANVAPTQSAPQVTTSTVATPPPPAPAAAAPPPAALGRTFSDERAKSQSSPAAPAAPAIAFAPNPQRPEPAQAPLRAKREAESDRAASSAGLAADSGAGVRALQKSVVESDPLRELERIAKLREAGDNTEADKALAEFRKRFPDFRIPDATWERVRPR